MEILFTYIENYNNIKNKGFCLSSKFNISYDVKQHKLIIKDYKFNLTEHFDKNILDIKAIIGANGVGKTSLLTYLFNECSGDEVMKTEKKDFIVCFSNNKIYISSPKSKPILKTDIKNETEQQYKIIIIPTENKLLYKKLEPFKGTNLVYFSNIFDNNHIEYTNSYAVNISTNYLLKNDKRLVYTDQKDQLQLIEQTEAYKTQDLIRQINFINKSKIKFDFELPSQIRIDVNSIDEKNFQNLINTNGFKKGSFKKVNEYIEILKKIKFKTTEVRGVVSNKTKLPHFWFEFQNAIFYSILCYFISQKIPRRDQNFDDIRIDIANAFFNCIYDINFDFIKLTKNIKSAEKRLFKEKNIKLNIYSDVLQAAKGMLKLSDKIIIANNIDNLNVVLNRDNLFFHQWVTSYTLLPKFNDFLFFSWNNLSSGQLARVNLLSRFYYGLNINSDSTLSNYIVFIDEGDILLHPNWQRKFINILNKDLIKLFSDKTVQFILTSHSPFVASDLSKAHILYFNDREGNNKDIDETFSQNIYSLLSSTFYLESPLGAFAEELLNDLITFLEVGKSEKIKSLIEAQKIIENIGEPMIKNELQKKLLTSESGNKKQLEELVKYLSNKLHNA